MDRLTRVNSTVAMTTISESPSHRIAVGSDSFRCPHCDDDHAIAFLEETDADAGRQGLLAVRYAEEAWDIARFLLVEVFGAVSPGSWAALEVLAQSDDGTAVQA
jgi:hypothetical protein